jgi:hypothetical protein
MPPTYENPTFSYSQNRDYYDSFGGAAHNMPEERQSYYPDNYGGVYAYDPNAILSPQSGQFPFIYNYPYPDAYSSSYYYNYSSYYPSSSSSYGAWSNSPSENSYTSNNSSYSNNGGNYIAGTQPRASGYGYSAASTKPTASMNKGITNQFSTGSSFSTGYGLTGTNAQTQPKLRQYSFGKRKAKKSAAAVQSPALSKHSASGNADDKSKCVDLPIVEEKPTIKGNTNS